MRRIEAADGARLAVKVEGHGPALVLVSGLGGTAAFWRPVVADLATTRTVVTMDQRGVAASERGTLPITIETLAQDVAVVVRALDLGSVDLCGHSTGAGIVLTVAGQGLAPVRGLVLSAGWLAPDAYIQSLFRMRLAVLERAGFGAYEMLTRFFTMPPASLIAADRFGSPDPLDPEREAAELARWSERIQALLAYDGTALAPRVTQPTLVLGVEDDLVIPCHHQRASAEAIPGTQLTLLGHGGHFYPVSRTKLFCARLRQFLT